MNINTGGNFTINNPVILTGTGTLFSNAGNINVNNAQTVTGNYAQTGNYTIGVTNTSTYGQLKITGNASFSSSYGFRVAAGSSLLAGHNYLNILSAGTISNFTSQTGTFSSGGTSYTYTIVKDASNTNALDLDVAAVTPSTTTTASSTTYTTNVISNSNLAAVGAANSLNVIATTSVAGMAGVITALNSLSGSAQSNAISRTLPAITGATSQAILNTQQGFNQVIAARQNTTAGMSSGEDFIANQNLWMKGYGSWATQNNQSGIDGYSVNTGGLAIGGETLLTPRASLGLVFAFGNSNVSSNNGNAPSSVSINSYQTGLYGSYILEPQLSWNYQLDAGISNNKESRNLSSFAGVTGVTGTNASASFNSFSTHIGTGLRQAWALSDKTTFIPSVRVDYTNVQSQGYTESGAGVLNLNVGSQTAQTLYLSSNLRLDQELTERLKVTGNVGAGYNTLNNQVQLTSAYQGGGPAFVTTGLAISPWLYNAGLGIIGQLDPNTEISLRYDVQASPTGYTNNMASARVRVMF